LRVRVDVEKGGSRTLLVGAVDVGAGDRLLADHPPVVAVSLALDAPELIAGLVERLEYGLPNRPEQRLVADDERAVGRLFGLDLDGVAKGDHGSPKDWLPSLDPLLGDDAFAEWSPSGTGLHIPLAGFSPPDWWADCQVDEHEGVEAEGAKFFTVTGDRLSGCGGHVADSGDHVEEWLADVWEAVRDEPAPPRRESNRSAESAAETERVPDGASGNATDIARAVDALDAQRVAEKTIVSKWNDQASTSEGVRAFYPTWGGPNCNGTANIVGEDVWTDTGGGGKGGPQVMAAIDMGELRADRAHPGDVSGDLWWDTVEHLRELGFAIPEYDASPRSAAAETAESQGQTDGGGAAAASGPDTDGAPITVEDRVAAEVLRPLDPPDDTEEITYDVAVNRFADILCDEYHFVRPRVDVRGWRDTLYVYDETQGIYEPHGKTWVETEAERLLGAVATNQRVNEIVGKIERRSLAEPGELTADPHRLVVENGIVDLHTGELDEHTPSEYHRVRVGWAFDPGATCERVDEFFHEIVADQDVRTLYQLVAHTLYSEYLAEKAAMLLGDGQNGKSVFLDLVEQFLGQQNVSSQSLQDISQKDFAANQLEGKLANVNPEIGDGGTVRDLNTFKQLTGRDTVHADVKFESPIQFENHATLVFAANRMPKMGEDTHALWRRWIPISFPYTFNARDPDAKDPIPKRKLMNELTEPSEMRGLLARAVEEISRWWDEGILFTEIDTPDEVREQMRRASEPVFDFAMTCLRLAGDEDAYVAKERVRECYRQYAKAEDLPTMEESEFGRRLMSIADLPIDSSQRRVDGSRITVYQPLELTGRGREVLGEDESGEDQNVTDSAPRWQAAADAVRDLEGDEPADEPMVVGALARQMTMRNARSAIQAAAERGAIYQAADGGWRVS